MSTKKAEVYPASLTIDYPTAKRNRWTTFARLIWAIPVLAILAILTATGGEGMSETGKQMSENAGGATGGIVAGLFVATALMILFRQRYPRWWFDFALELNRFSARVGSYLFLLTDQYPSTVEKQSVHLNLAYPNVQQDLNRWLPLIKWVLALPHYFVLCVLLIGVIGATIMAWFAILFTGRHPKGLFEYVVGVGRWSVRVDAYAFLLITDEYPPFSLK
jgi:hypothetical protein